MQGYNRPITLGEIEVESLDSPIDIPPWAVLRVNGKSEFQFLGTAELQATPFWLLSDAIKRRYNAVISANSYNSRKKI